MIPSVRHSRKGKTTETVKRSVVARDEKRERRIGFEICFERRADRIGDG